MRKRLYLFTLSFISLIPRLTKAAPLLENLKGKDQTSDLDSIYTLIGNASGIILSIGMVTAVIMICVGGILYITSGGDEKRTEKAKQTLLYSIGGFLLLIMAKFIVIVFGKILAGTPGI